MHEDDEKRVSCWRILFLIVTVAAAEGRRDCFAVTNMGAVKGSKEKSQNGNSFCSFRGIPYAAPPIGELRFKAPRSRQPWNGVLNARHDGPVCIQKILGIALGQEDCLYLNVYTPEPIPEHRETLLPVILYIHGGKFSVGSGASFVTGPTYLMNKRIVLVTINYRLGVMGFLSTGDSEAPGNYGMKDQVAAMRWVRDNIVEFGGDPDKVTIQGQSAGSKSVHFHMFSPSSKGLFRGAISQSGSAFMPWVLPPEEPLLKAKAQARALRCSTNDSISIISCLRGIEARDLVRNEVEMWQPVVETASQSNPEPFLTATPLELVRSGNFYKVPWLIGSTSQDGAFFGARKISSIIGRALFNMKLDSEGPKEFFLELSLNRSLIPDVWNKIKQFYFSSENSPSTEELIKLYTDRYVVHAVHKATMLHSMAGHQPIYQYNFAYRGLYSFVDLAELGKVPMNLGVVHMDDLIYLIPVPVFNIWPPGHPDREVIDLMVTLWTNFATYGNPTTRRQWEPFSITNRTYLEFGHDESKPGLYGIKPVKLKIKSSLYEERMKFWDSLPLKENL